VFRSDLSKVGLPGAREGINELDPTIAGLLKDRGYATGQFGKNHLGDRDEHLPTNHGFDEFYGNLYHLNAEEEPENGDYFKDPAPKKKFGPRGVMHSWAQAYVGQFLQTFSGIPAPYEGGKFQPGSGYGEDAGPCVTLAAIADARAFDL